MTDEQAAALLDVTPEQFKRLAALPAFPQRRTREALDEFKRKRDAAAAQWRAA